MGNIRRQTIISSTVIYIGFLVGAVTTFLYTKEGLFSLQQYALTRIFFDFAQNTTAFGALGIIPVIYKFHPYYKDNLAKRDIDLMSWGMLTAFVGFLLVLLAGLIFQPIFVKAYSEKSKLIVDFYWWLFPFALGQLLFSVTESFAWALQKTVLSNFLKETLLRIVTLLLIVLFYFKIIGFALFMYLFAFLFFFIFLILAVYLYSTKQLYFPTRISRVTKKFWKKMVTMQAILYSGTLIMSIAATIDSFIIAKFQGLAVVATFSLAQYAANLVQVPQRSIQSVAVASLSQAWKNKNYIEINRIYKRSCINLLIMALFIFGNVWLNALDGIRTLGIQKEYEAGLGVIFILGMVRIVDAATGLNAMVINTSTFWRFDFYSGIVLLAFRLPLTYFLIKNYGIIGSATAELIAYTIYNIIRSEFLRRKFKMQPFDRKTILAFITAIFGYGVAYYIFKEMNGWLPIFGRTMVFSGILIGAVFQFKLTPDAHQLLENFIKKVRKSE
ncbi:MAG: polysaccharide biosynthesis C-terminal domain-containing protein [Sediminibacterium sp.]|nr:polysaccharide biosynthesis C-terminal domain-containing protein [Sediminibacterium sp.]